MHDMCSSIGCWGGVYAISLIEYKLMDRYTIYITLISFLVQNASKKKVLFLNQTIPSVFYTFRGVCKFFEDFVVVVDFAR